MEKHRIGCWRWRFHHKFVAMEMRGLLFFFALLSVTAVVPVLFSRDKKDGAGDIVIAAPPVNPSHVTVVSWKPR